MKIKKLHFIYIILIEAIFIILLFTRIGATDTTLTNYISFAATISSLILAVLAIIQGFFSSNSLNDTISSLNNSSSNLASGTNNLENLITELKAELITNTSKLVSIEENMKNNNSLLVPEMSLQKISKDITSQMEENFKQNNSPIGYFIMYALFLSYEKKVYFTLDVFFDDDSDWSQYSYGYIVALHVSEIITLDIELLGENDSYKDRKVKVNNLKSNFFSKIENTVKKEIDKSDKKSKSDLEKHLKKIVDAFK